MNTVVVVIFWGLKLSRVFENNKDGSVDKWIESIKRTHRKYGEYDIKLLPVE